MFAPRRVNRAGWLLLACAAPLVARQPDCVSGQDVEFASRTRKDHIGRILAPVMVNGEGPFRFIIDTGASHSTISPQLATRLGLTVTDSTPMLVNGITGTALVPSVEIEKLEAGALVYEDVRFPVVWAPVMAGADGILGVAGLKKERILVEFSHNRVCVTQKGLMGTPLGFIRIPAYRLEGGLMSIDARVGSVKARAIIDTGAERSLGNLALREGLERLRNAMQKTKMTDVYGSTDAVVQGEIGTAPLIALGPIKIADVDLVYGDFHIFQVWKLEDRPALIIGMDVLGSVQSLEIDFRNQEIYVEGVYLNVHGDARVQ